MGNHSFFMAKTRVQKEEIVTQLVGHMKAMQSLVLTSFSGLNSVQEQKLRRLCEKEAVEYMVVKQSLFKKSIATAGISAEIPMEGNIAAFFGLGDSLAPAKILAKFLKENKQIKTLGGIFEGSIVSESEVAALGKLPGKLELLAKLVGTIRAPLSGLMGVLSGNQRKLVFVLSQIQASK